MKQGVRLMGEARPGAVVEALSSFDRALELRRRLPVETASRLRFGLAACWVNRADALTRLGDAGRVADALRSYDEAIALLRDLPMEEDARFPRRLAIAYQNRGLALLGQGRAAAAEAAAAFTDAVAVLDHPHASSIPDRRYLLGVIWMNLAVARASEATAESDALGRDAALRAIGLVAEQEASDADAAEVGLKARHVVCQTIADRLGPPPIGDDVLPDEVHEATDTVDDALELVRRWEHSGVTRFRGIACELFRFGARVYARYQPQFVDEFVADNMDPGRSSPDYVASAEIRSAAREALGLLRGPGL